MPLRRTTNAAPTGRSVGVAILLACIWCTAVPTATAAIFDSVSPEDAGFWPESLDEVAAYADSIGYAAIVLARDGQVLFEWGDVSSNYQCHSIRKPLMSALYGIYVEKGVIDLDATVGELGIDDVPPKLTPDEKRATVRHLLEANSGVYHDAAAETQEMENARPERGSHEPGEHFYYNNWGFNAAGTIFREVTGEDIFEAFEEEIAGPIGMKDFDDSECEYNYEREDSEHPAYRFRMSATDIARFGVLYQQEGEWSGRRVIPRDWVEESTTTHAVVSADAGVGYGYMWATVERDSKYQTMIGAAGYLHAGLGGHILAVFPDEELVVVARVDTDGDGPHPGERASLKLVNMILGAQVGE